VGCPVAVEGFPGNPGEPTTLALQLQQLRAQVHLQRIVLVGDRGRRTNARIRTVLQPVPGLDWVSVLRRSAIQQLVEAGSLDLTRLAETDVLECTTSTDPQERLIACRHPLLARERARKRAALLQATERELDALVQATTRPTRQRTGQAALALRVEKGRKRFTMGKHVQSAITDTQLRSTRHTQRCGRGTRWGLWGPYEWGGGYPIRARISWKS
jgi:hypothetical protein